MKLRRSDRMVVISNYLINNPYKLTSLNTFAEKYESAKSSISEDIVIIKRAFEEIEIGHIQTVTGAGGGVIFTPSISSQDAKEMVEDLRTKLSESDRIEKMFLSKRSLKAGSRVLIVDDFLKGGGTVNGMISLLREFDSELAGVAVFADNAQEEREKQFDYKSLLKVTNIDVKNQAIDVEVGNIFDEDK
ncbi:phosphoribosyltransferase family protein [Streptococcus pneumoniae]|uniref:phosphoribosyltransferase family protein n=1 Tax=Streptococcus pneumoniae TaxID=1313 RepID=UPI000845D519|nr:phosphoribosyltransferase family protein [Streptococcus pneumoniae]ODO19259.1 hypothetical protein A4366_01065 [Streptococcus pneumoniae]